MCEPINQPINRRAPRSTRSPRRGWRPSSSRCRSRSGWSGCGRRTARLRGPSAASGRPSSPSATSCSATRQDLSIKIYLHQDRSRFLHYFFALSIRFNSTEGDRLDPPLSTEDVSQQALLQQFQFIEPCRVGMYTFHLLLPLPWLESVLVVCRFLLQPEQTVMNKLQVEALPKSNLTAAVLPCHRFSVLPCGLQRASPLPLPSSSSCHRCDCAWGTTLGAGFPGGLGRSRTSSPCLWRSPTRAGGG